MSLCDGENHKNYFENICYTVKKLVEIPIYVCRGRRLNYLGVGIFTKILICGIDLYVGISSSFLQCRTSNYYK
jgi:hypothetical protein